ncbi:unnamed protein product [Mycoplasmopsis agalactiae]|uniref:Uncharacterized protein n=1 Tax=Mycoplasmopsis agalactiae TaxID=2110 RepID=D3VQI6_MYCAA|nr:unnamed protein product [Mycoplasmopsis agalactiae]
MMMLNQLMINILTLCHTIIISTIKCNFNEFINYLKHTINSFSSKPKTAQKNQWYKEIYKVLYTYNKFINETITNKYYTSGNAKTFVYHDLKRYIGKNFGLKSINTIIRTIMSVTNHNLIII